MDEEVKVSHVALSVLYNGEKVKTQNFKLTLMAREKESCSMKIPRISIVGRINNGGQVKVKNVRAVLFSERVRHPVAMDYHTLRAVGDHRYRLALDNPAKRTVRNRAVVNAPAVRAVLSGRTLIDRDFATLRRTAVSVRIDEETLVHRAVAAVLDFAGRRFIGRENFFDYATVRKIANENFQPVVVNATTKRMLSSIPTVTYGYAECETVDLGKVYEVLPAVMVDGTAQAEIRTAEQWEEYGDWQPYTPHTVKARYLQVRLRVNGYCRGASLTVYAPSMDEVVTSDVDAEGRWIYFTHRYYKPPAVFPAANSAGSVVISKVDTESCYAYILNQKGEKTAGNVTLLVRGN